MLDSLNVSKYQNRLRERKNWLETGESVIVARGRLPGQVHPLLWPLNYYYLLFPLIEQSRESPLNQVGDHHADNPSKWYFGACFWKSQGSSITLPAFFISPVEQYHIFSTDHNHRWWLELAMTEKWTNQLFAELYISKDPILFSNPNVFL
jgi:hypothetical protein